MKPLVSRSILMVGLMVASPAFSIGALGNAKVVSVRIDGDGRGMVIFDQAIGGTPPGCVIGAYSNALAFGAGDGGKAVLALALAAKATNATITVYGSGTCAHYGVVEDWNYGMLN